MKQKQIKAELDELLTIKSRIRFHQSCRILFEEIIVLLCILSLIYKQNILSFLIYSVVLYYAIKRFSSRKAISLCKYTILVVFIFQYLFIVLNMSTYSTFGWPTQIQIYNVYPNQQYYYFNIPICFALSQNLTSIAPNAPPVKTVNLELFSFYGLDLQSDSFEGLWVDFLITVLIYFYLNSFNFWLVATPHKVVISQRT